MVLQFKWTIFRSGRFYGNRIKENIMNIYYDFKDVVQVLTYSGLKNGSTPEAKKFQAILMAKVEKELQRYGLDIALEQNGAIGTNPCLSGYFIDGKHYEFTLPGALVEENGTMKTILSVYEKLQAEMSEYLSACNDFEKRLNSVFEDIQIKDIT